MIFSIMLWKFLYAKKLFTCISRLVGNLLICTFQPIYTCFWLAIGSFFSYVKWVGWWASLMRINKCIWFLLFTWHFTLLQIYLNLWLVINFLNVLKYLLHFKTENCKTTCFYFKFSCYLNKEYIYFG